MKKPVVALFDFDGTLTEKDAYLSFIKYVHGWKFYLGFFLLSPILVLFYLKIVKRTFAKETTVALFFRNWSREKFSDYALSFCATQIPGMLRKEAIQRMNWHKSQGHRVVVVSANFREIIEVWCKKNGLELLCTELEIQENKITGKFSRPNCYGPEKVHRISEVLEPKAHELFSYGDTNGDKEMLALADHP